MDTPGESYHYTWAESNKPQDGLLLIGQSGPVGAVQAAWVDGWHMGDQMMHCQGAAGSDGALSVKGSYAVPPGPDWGWRIDILPGEGERFRLIMYNITPEGQEYLAVEAVYSRR